MSLTQFGYIPCGGIGSGLLVVGGTVTVPSAIMSGIVANLTGGVRE